MRNSVKRDLSRIPDISDLHRFGGRWHVRSGWYWVPVTAPAFFYRDSRAQRRDNVTWFVLGLLFLAVAVGAIAKELY